MTNFISLGKIADTPSASTTPNIQCHDPALRRHLERPWFRAHVARQLGIPAAASPSVAGNRTAQVRETTFGRHFVTFGSSGSGKTRLIEHVLNQFQEQGHSLVVMDPKAQTLTALLVRARQVGLTPQQVTLLSPRTPAGIPGWNPLAVDLPLTQRAGDFVAILERSTSAWGHRLQDILTNACLLVAAHGLSLVELVECLRREEYLEGLLQCSAPGPPSRAYTEAVRYFRHEFLAWSRSVRTDAISPVLNKLREMARNEFLAPLACARRQTLDLAGLWQRPGLVLVHLDRATLGEEGTRLLGGLVANHLLRTALRAPGPVPVTLALDEMSTAEHFLGEALTDIVTVARSQNLRLVAACQHLAQLSDPLRAALLANTAVQVFFHLGPTDARLVAQSLAVGTPPRLKRATVTADTADRFSGQPPRVLSRHVLRDGQGQPLRVDSTTWERCRWDGLFGDTARSSDPLAGLRALAQRRVGRLYVQAADTGEPVEVGQYVQGLRPREYWLDGPAPLTLVVSFPRPRLTGVERGTESEAMQAWTRILQELPVQQAVLRVAGQEPVVMQVAEVPDPARSQEQRAFLAAALRANGQSQQEAQAAYDWRLAQMERVAGGIVEGEHNHEEDVRGGVNGDGQRQNGQRKMGTTTGRPGSRHTNGNQPGTNSRKGILKPHIASDGSLG